MAATGIPGGLRAAGSAGDAGGCRAAHGKTVSFPVVVAGCQGERYLVSMLGEGTNWAGHVRAADGRAAPRPR
jgi:hypothetical protein